VVAAQQLRAKVRLVAAHQPHDQRVLLDGRQRAYPRGQLGLRRRGRVAAAALCSRGG
jgi:hypothetical protein